MKVEEFESEAGLEEPEGVQAEAAGIGEDVNDPPREVGVLDILAQHGVELPDDVAAEVNGKLVTKAALTGMRQDDKKPLHQLQQQVQQLTTQQQQALQRNQFLEGQLSARPQNGEQKPVSKVDALIAELGGTEETKDAADALRRLAEATLADAQADTALKIQASQQQMAQQIAPMANQSRLQAAGQVLEQWRQTNDYEGMFGKGSEADALWNDVKADNLLALQKGLQGVTPDRLLVHPKYRDRSLDLQNKVRAAQTKIKNDKALEGFTSAQYAPAPIRPARPGVQRPQRERSIEDVIGVVDSGMSRSRR